VHSVLYWSVMEAYCVKCKTRREMQNPQPLFNAKGGAYTRGSCGVCGTTLTRFGATEEHKNTNREELVALARANSRPPVSGGQSKSSSNGRRDKKARAGGNGNNVRASPQDSTPSATFAAKSDGAPLVIVESPAKAKTIGRFLGRDFRVRASVGHIRDLPMRQMGVDIDHDFTPHYVITPKKKEVVKQLKELARGAREIYLATDPDREGEAISWHLVQTLDRDIGEKPVRRVEFHEITREAVDRAFTHPRGIDMNLVNSQQARRILDRLVGYSLSPLLRKKMTRKGLSAGRVQSVAVRLVVEREREIQNFVAVEYWSIEAELKKKTARTWGQGDAGVDGDGGGANVRDVGNDTESPPNARPSPLDTFRAKLIQVAGKDFECHTGAEAFKLQAILEHCKYRVLDVRRKEVLRNPSPPFITSTLQQEASRKLHFNAKRTMATAQQLYEGLPVGDEGNVGLITYMRTDSTNVAEGAQKEAWIYIKDRFGESFLPKTPRFYTKKVAGAQEAHEAIRPTKTFREPHSIKTFLNSDQFRLYELIWKRFVASQMASAVFDTTAVDIEAKGEGDFLFRANGSLLKFPGFLAVYGRSVGDGDDADDSDRRLPHLVKDEPLNLIRIIPEQHFTEPPPRYTEATLIKALEQFGVGRPSTYAPILSNIEERGYVEQIENRRLKPTDLGFIVNDLLVAHFSEIVDVGFTAKMEEKLDKIAEGKEDWVGVLSGFYAPFEKTLQRAATEMPEVKLEDEKTDIVCEVCGAPMVVKRGRFGKFIACSTFPNCKNTKSLTTGVRCPECKKGELTQKRTRRGRTFYGCSRYPNCTFATWDQPLSEACPNCGGLLVATARGRVRCLNGDYQRAADTTAASNPAPTVTGPRLPIPSP
jgi:DNA topoisomerase I